jgi:response regulator RpfG family c-di-GMP phosphodiesterase
MARKILFVDDDLSMLGSFKTILRNDYDVHIADGAKAAIKKVNENKDFAVVVSDFNMPGMDGVSFLNKMRDLSPDTVRIMLTGFADGNIVANAVNKSQVFRVLTKPCSKINIIATIQEGLNFYDLTVTDVHVRRGTLRGCIQLLVETLKIVNPEACARSIRILDLIRKISKICGISINWEIELAAILSNIGCIAIPREFSYGSFTSRKIESEYNFIHDCHPAVGASLLWQIPGLERVGTIIGHQHDCYNDKSCFDDIGVCLLKIAGDYYKLESRGTPPASIVNILSRDHLCYEPKLLSALELIVGRESGHVLRQVSIYQLIEGMELDDDVVTEQGLHLLAKGVKLDITAIRKLLRCSRSFNVVEPIKVRVPFAPTELALPPTAAHSKREPS